MASLDNISCSRLPNCLLLSGRLMVIGSKLKMFGGSEAPVNVRYILYAEKRMMEMPIASKK